MVHFLELIYPFGHLTIAFFELIILLFAYPFFRLSKNLAMIVLPIVLISTIYNNLVLWSGSFINEGELLENLSQVRYLLHYLSVPLLIIVAIELAHLSGAKWANQFMRFSSWLLAFGLAGYDISKNFIGLELITKTFANVLRYVPKETVIPTITIIINIFLLLVGIGIWVRTKNWPWLFIGSLIALVGNSPLVAVAADNYFNLDEVGTLTSSFSESILSLSLLLTQYNFEDSPEKEQEEQNKLEKKQAEIPVGWKRKEYSGYQIYFKEEKTYTIY